MKHRMVKSILAVIVLVTLTVISRTEIASASGTIYIRESGEVDPPTAPINRVGDTYTLASNIYETVVVERNNVVVDGRGYMLQGSESGAGFSLTNRNNVTLKNIHITQFDYGIYLAESNGNTISHNNLTSNAQYGIFVSNSSGNIIHGNKMVKNNHGGIFLWLTNNTEVNTNNVSENGEDGINIGYKSFNNTIAYNIVCNNSQAGISLGWEFSTGNRIVGNNIANSGWTGIYIVWSTVSGNEFCYNNLDNALQVYQGSVDAINIWDEGYPSGGNYWSDYTDVDEYNGPNQDQLGSDYIWDHPYVIDPNNQDHYPLVNKWSVADVNHDGKVNVLDAAAISAHWYPGPPVGPLGYDSGFDVNGDGAINVLDAATVSAYWTGPPKGPMAE